MAKTIEVDEEQFLNDQKLRQTVSKIMANPKAAKLVEQAYKEVDPKAPTPRLDAEAVQNETVDTDKKSLAELQKQIADDNAESEKNAKLTALNNKVESGLSKLRREGWTEEGIKGVQAIMDEHGILDPEIAASHFEKLHPPQAPVTPGGSGAWDFMSMPADGADEDLKKLIETKGESGPLLDKMARDALNEVRGQSRR